MKKESNLKTRFAICSAVIRIVLKQRPAVSQKLVCLIPEPSIFCHCYSGIMSDRGTATLIR